MDEPPNTTDDPLEALRAWFGLLGRYCAAVDFDSAKSIFAADVVSFGTKAQIVAGIELLRRNQWEGIWPKIDDFRIDVDAVRGGGNETPAWGVTTWTSTARAAPP